LDLQDMRRLVEEEPFLGYMGLALLEVRTGLVVVHLALRPEVTNHTGMVHGGAQYVLGEATAIALAATLFPDRLAELDLDLLTAQAAITYHHPARGDLTARAALTAEECERLTSEFNARGKLRFPVDVVLSDDNAVSATTLSVECAVRLHGS
jgi:uncharacterized protein (TIGR00369 family)